MEREVDAQPLGQRAFAEVAEPRMGPVFIISTMAAVFNMFVLCVWIIFCFVFCSLWFFLFNFFYYKPFIMNRFDWIMSSSLRAVVSFSSFLLPTVTSHVWPQCCQSPDQCGVNRPLSSATLMPNSSQCCILSSHQDMLSSCLPAM